MFIRFLPVTARPNVLRTVYDSYRPGQFPEASATKGPLRATGREVAEGLLARQLNKTKVAVEKLVNLPVFVPNHSKGAVINRTPKGASFRYQSATAKKRANISAHRAGRA